MKGSTYWSMRAQFTKVEVQLPINGFSFLYDGFVILDQPRIGRRRSNTSVRFDKAAMFPVKHRKIH